MMLRKFSIVALLTALFCTIFPVGQASASSFPDVQSFKSEINYLVNENIVSGYPDNTFKPNNNVTRAEAAVMIVKAKGLSGKEQNSRFTDVPNNSWASGYIETAVENGLFVGTSHDKFEPNRGITRGEMAVVLVRALGLTETGAVHFDDVPTDKYYAASVNMTTVAGITASGKNYNPDSSINRGQFSAMLTRALNESFRVQYVPSYPTQYVVTDVGQTLNVRSGPGMNYGVVDKLSRNTPVNVISQNGVWHQIKSGNTTGYVHHNYLGDSPVSNPVTPPSSPKNRKIVIDAGHGGHDPGAKGYGINEKDMVLDIAKKTANHLSSNYSGVEVKLTRSSDQFKSLSERPTIANNWGADYFVSMHLNAFNGVAGGFETFIFNGNVSQETIDRQKDIHNYIIERMAISDRGQKRANFAVLRESHMPAILIEYLFIDNKKENDLIRDASYRTKLARITADAIANSFNLPKK